MTEIPSTVAETETRVGEAVRQMRLEAGFDQAELATRANISRSAIQSLEAGSGSRLRTLISTLRALDRLDAIDSLMPVAGLSPLQLLAESRRSVRAPQRHRKSQG
jgi:transcriptional regulator with XRE-family HTH domain